MDRKEFIKRTCQIGVLSSCTSLCGAAIGKDIFADDDKKAKAGDTKETPKEVKVEFMKKWMKRFMNQLDQHIDEPTRQALMRSNGKACYREAYGDSRSFKDGNNHINEFVEKYRKWTGVPESIRVEGNTIYYEYVGAPNGVKVADGYCLCCVVEDGPKELSPTYCNCSVGYVTEMFKDITNREVIVTLKESLRSGGKKCRFEIRYT